MSELKITSDCKWKNFIYGYQLTPKEKKEFDYVSEEEIDLQSFFRYRKTIYSLDQFMRLDKPSPFPGEWQGYHSDSYFSGVLIEVSNDGEQYRVGTYLS